MIQTIKLAASLLAAKAANAILSADNIRLRASLANVRYPLMAAEELASKLGTVRDVLGGGHVGARPETTLEAARRVVSERDELRANPVHVFHTAADERIAELEDDNAKLTQELANVRRVHLDSISSRDAEIERQREKLLQARDERIRLGELANVGVNPMALRILSGLIKPQVAEPLSSLAQRVADEFVRMRGEPVDMRAVVEQASP